MKFIGFIFITVGLVLLVIFAYQYFNEKNRILSPVPDNGGVRVIFLTPTK